MPPGFHRVPDPHAVHRWAVVGDDLSLHYEGEGAIHGAHHEMAVTLHDDLNTKAAHAGLAIRYDVVDLSLDQNAGIRAAIERA